MDEYQWIDDIRRVDLDELSNLYRIAPLGDKPPEALATVFANSMFKSFVYTGENLIGAGRALADGMDCAYIADVAVHPDHSNGDLARPGRRDPLRTTERCPPMITSPRRAPGRGSCRQSLCDASRCNPYATPPTRTGGIFPAAPLLNANPLHVDRDGEISD